MKALNKKNLTAKTLRRFKYSVAVFALLSGSQLLMMDEMGGKPDIDTFTMDNANRFSVDLRQLQEVGAGAEGENGSEGGNNENTGANAENTGNEQSTEGKGKEAAEVKKTYKFDGQEYEDYLRTNHSQGYVDEYFDGDRCDSYLILPGTTLLPKSLMATVYFLTLMYLFLGISIIADIFMEAIEVVCSKTKQVKVSDKEGKEFTVEIPIWNATIANLTLMALGSSAPEILLSVIETLNTLGKTPGELGPFAIVGSAAFNLLAISGVCILSVGDEPKKIFDLGVFAVTSFFSLFAYVWMTIVLNDDLVTMQEAYLTFGFFFVLVILAFSADKFKEHTENRRMSQEQIEEKNKQDEINIKKSKLRSHAKKYGDNYVLSVVQGIHHETANPDHTEIDTKEIKQLYKEILGVEDLKEVEVQRLLDLLQPDSLLERFAAKKANNMVQTKDFVNLKSNIKGQIENVQALASLQDNENVGFKCLHYSVTESNGQIEITIIKKENTNDYTFGVRTIDGSAKAGKDYNEYNSQHTIKQKENEMKVQITINDNQDWEPDMDFYVELYDTETMAKLAGENTKTQVTILDEDFPGTLGFKATDIRVNKKTQNVDVVLVRTNGSDGEISCMIKTQPLSETKNGGKDDKGLGGHNAIEWEDYIPIKEKINFENTEQEKTVSIQLLANIQAQVDHADAAVNKSDDGEEGQAEEAVDLMFKVLIHKAEPEAVKISKKNVCIVTIVQQDDDNNEDENEKLLNYFLQVREPTWGQQFKNAVMLGPQVDSDNFITSQVTLGEGLFHFLTIGWKLVFAIVPPTKYYGGVASFLVALIMIGFITAIVEQVATIFGCSIGLPASINAITIVALGTSLPDTFASKTAAQTSKYADSAIGNITGSNSVNVFLGLGLPWVIASNWYNNQPLVDGKNQVFNFPAGNLSYSVFLFLITSVTCFIVLIARRIVIGGEIGGPKVSKYISGAIMFSLWIIYVIFSILKASQSD